MHVICPLSGCMIWAKKMDGSESGLKEFPEKLAAGKTTKLDEFMEDVWLTRLNVFSQTSRSAYTIPQIIKLVCRIAHSSLRTSRTLIKIY